MPPGVLRAPPRGTPSGCSAARPLPSAICLRQLVPAATMVAWGAARTAGSNASSAILIETS